MISNHPPIAACSRCGSCCRTAAGIVLPTDASVIGTDGNPDANRIRLLLAGGRYAVDWWDADEDLPQTHYIRPAHKGREGVRLDESWGGECTFLGRLGCTLERTARPGQCLALKPVELESHKLGCHYPGLPPDNAKLYFAQLWAPFQDVLHAALGGAP